MDILIRNAKLHSGEAVDIAIADGIITKIGADIKQSAKQQINVQERLTLPAFVNGQLHRCKAFWRRKLSNLPKLVQQL